MTLSQTSQKGSNRLGSLAEGEETPATTGRSNLKSIASSPMTPRTPATARPKPSMEEMHPSKAQQSTARLPDAGLQLGFSDISAGEGGLSSGSALQSPSKAGISSSFDFRFARPGPQLGSEAQRMMDELRGEAMKIKARMAAERYEKQRETEGNGEEDGKNANTTTGRKIAQPKCKAGRYSNAHMAEFKKMDSIENHPSSFRAQLNRLVPSTANLKRTQSAANLDEREAAQGNSQPGSHHSSNSDRLENTAPSKRSRKAIADDTSSARPVSRAGIPQPTTPNQARPSNSLEAIMTPTQASLARVASVKNPTTQIPTLSRPPSKANLASGTPRGLTKSATTANVSTLPNSPSKSFLRSPGKFERVRSILRRVSPSPKKPTNPPSSIPSLKRSPSKPNFEHPQPSTLTTPKKPPPSKITKHVNFTPEVTAINRATTAQQSPSPIKYGIPRSATRKNMSVQSSTPNSTNVPISYPSIASHPNVAQRSSEVEYPSLSGVRPLPEVPQTATARPPPSVPGTFTFRSDHTIDFVASPKGFGPSSGQSSIRQVRQSMDHTMPGSFPGNNKENTRQLPSVPHGMTNKKRRRVDSDDEKDGSPARSPKKSKLVAAEGAELMAPRLIATPKSKLSSTAKKGVLSLSRLNMLARPKMRK
ncbi:hypothetical protein BJ875DRAFT_461997 [Amylocarpus encephaloides]|uniref:Erythromycin esterase n=1 Tax=Amylocarpus encephaloides TaxID=45428 RepID=A0A9P8C531_9HELO|nr:hypothetical protein BJ875DRAFT_461997 [Amylocarpus encephaloides]